MNYIINPNWIYWIYILDALKWSFLGLFIITSIAVFILGLLTYVEYDDFGKGSEDFIRYKKILKILLLVFVITFICFIFIPSKQLLIEMKVFELATKDNINITVENLKAVIDYIINAIKELR